VLVEEHRLKVGHSWGSSHAVAGMAVAAGEVVEEETVGRGRVQEERGDHVAEKDHDEAGCDE
jgi:hypothetical protein